MDQKAIDDLKARLEKSRRFEVEVDGRRFQMLLPDPFTERRVLRSIAGEEGASGAGWLEQASRDLVEAALVGWEGVQYCDLLRDSDNSDLPYQPALAKLLLNERLDILDALRGRLAEERQKRRDALEADAKNSASASTGNRTRRAAAS